MRACRDCGGHQFSSSRLSNQPRRQARKGPAWAMALQHRLVYQVLEDVRMVKVLRMWSYYD